jgi:hypothetical protein
LAAFYTEVLGNLVCTPDLQAKGLNQILDSAANGREWRHLFGPELVSLLEEVVRWRLCVKHSFPVQEHQQRALPNSFHRVKLFLFEKELLMDGESINLLKRHIALITSELDKVNIK